VGCFLRGGAPPITEFRIAVALDVEFRARPVTVVAAVRTKKGHVGARETLERASAHLTGMSDS
jgi:hypothetical protein